MLYKYKVESHPLFFLDWFIQGPTQEFDFQKEFHELITLVMFLIYSYIATFCNYTEKEILIHLSFHASYCDL